MQSVTYPLRDEAGAFANSLIETEPAGSPFYIALSPLKHLEQFMMDVVMLAIGFAFFALSIAYVYACDLL
jgi:hypothetical protein